MIKKVLLILLLSAAITTWACDECDSGPLDLKTADIELLVSACEEILNVWNTLSLNEQRKQIHYMVGITKVLIYAPKESWNQKLINRAYTVTSFIDKWQEKYEK